MESRRYFAVRESGISPSNSVHKTLAAVECVVAVIAELIISAW
jgi:hypothetical protein